MNASDPALTHWVTLVSALVGAFLGSASAFLLENLRRKRDEREGRHASMFRAQLVLLQQLEALYNLHKQYLDEFRNHPQRAMVLPRFMTGITSLRLDFASLSFVPLLDTDHTLVHRAALAELGFVNSVQALDARNDMMKTIQADPATILRQINMDNAQADIAIHPRYAVQLKAMTDNLYDAVDDAIVQLERAIRDLRVAMVRIFPGWKAFEIGPPSDKPQDGPA